MTDARDLHALLNGLLARIENGQRQSIGSIDNVRAVQFGVDEIARYRDELARLSAQSEARLQEVEKERDEWLRKYCNLDSEAQHWKSAAIEAEKQVAALKDVAALGGQQLPLEGVASLIHDLRLATTKDDAWAVLCDYGRLAQAAADVQRSQEVAALGGQPAQEQSVNERWLQTEFEGARAAVRRYNATNPPLGTGARVHESVTRIVDRLIAAEARLTALAGQLEDVGDALDGQYPDDKPCVARAVQQQRKALDAAKEQLLTLAGQLAPLVQLLNGWQELGEEMGRVISSLTQEEYESAFPDWFGPRLFDLQVKAKQWADTLAALQRSLDQQ